MNTGIRSVVWVLGLEKLWPESLNRPVICSKVMMEQDNVGRRPVTLGDLRKPSDRVGHKAGLFLLLM